jgi:hypothetical protein
VARRSRAESTAQLVADETGDGQVRLEGSAPVESVSIRSPREFRDHVVYGEDFPLFFNRLGLRVPHALRRHEVLGKQADPDPFAQGFRAFFVHGVLCCKARKGAERALNTVASLRTSLTC